MIVFYHVARDFLATDHNNHLASTGERCVEEVTRAKHGWAVVKRNDNNRVFTTLALMHGDGIGMLDFLKKREIVGGNFVFKNDFIFVFLVVLPSAIIATVLHAPAWVVFACLKCDQILKCFVAVVKINRFDWMKNLTR